MAKAKLTKRYVDAIDTTKPGLHWDSEITGFGINVMPSGQASYIFQYRNALGTSRRPTIGKVGSMTPDEARKAAEAMRRSVAAGLDPLEEKRERRNAATVGDLMDSYLASEKFLKEKVEKTRDIDEGRINNHLRPLLGKVKVEALTSEKVKKASSDIEEGKTATAPKKIGPRAVSRVRGGPGAARKSIRLLKTITHWAKVNKLITVDPIAEESVEPDGEKDVILEDSDYGRMVAAIDQLQAEKKISASAADAIRAISYTGARRGEIAGLKWKFVDLELGLITIPAKAHKTGRKTGKPRIIGLPAPAQDIIARQPEGELDDYVFQPAGGEGPVNLSKPWAQIRALAKLPPDGGLHALRHTLATNFAEDGAEAAQIMAALGHKNLATSQKYVHARKAKQQALAERAAARTIAGMTGVPVKPAAEKGR